MFIIICIFLNSIVLFIVVLYGCVIISLVKDCKNGGDEEKC